MPSSNLVQSVVKAMDILHTVSNAAGGIRLDDLSESLGMKKTTVHNLVRTLRSRDYLKKAGGNRFQLGPAVSELLIGQQHKDNMRRAEIQMRKLQKQLPECVLTYSELSGTEIYCRLRMSADQPGLLQKPVAIVFAPYNSATGVCFQAFYEEYHLAVLEKYPFDELATRKWRDIKQFEQHLSDVRKRGYFLEYRDKSRVGLTVPAGEYFVLGASIFDCPDKQLEAIKRQAVLAGQIISGK